MADALDLPRLCIDGRRVPGAPTGVARYAANLRAALTQAGATPLRLVDSDWGDVAPPRPGLAALLGRMAVAAWPRARRARLSADNVLIADDIFRQAQRHFDLYGRLLEVDFPGPAGVMHWTYPLPLYVRGWRNLYTVHDLIPVLQPELTAIGTARYARLLHAIARRADRIVTVSEAVRQDLIGWLGYPADRVVDCGQGIGPTAPPAGALPPGLAPDDFFLFIGTVERRKNISRLIEAYRRAGLTRRLVLVGPHGWQADRICAEGRKVPGVLSLGYQPPEMVARLLADAAALLFPSLAEGFGIPVIEAMAAGTPVLTTARGALAEVAGEAALLVEPIDVEAIAEGIAQLDRDPDLRARLAAAGLDRARTYSPARHAERLIALYRAAAP